jgi:lysophospholipase L1-like esterase
MAVSNTIVCDFTSTGASNIRTWRYNYGQRIQLIGANIDETMNVQWSYKGVTDVDSRAITKVSDKYYCDIPNEALEQDGKITGYVCTPYGATFNTVYKIELTPSGRPSITEDTSTQDLPVYAQFIVELTALNVWEDFDGGAYVVNNKVAYEGSSYVCIQDTTNQLPTDTDYWLLIAKGYPEIACTYLPNDTDLNTIVPPTYEAGIYIIKNPTGTATKHYPKADGRYDGYSTIIKLTTLGTSPVAQIVSFEFGDRVSEYTRTWIIDSWVGWTLIGVSYVSATGLELNPLGALILSTGYEIPTTVALANKLEKNTAITSATKTKVTYDAKGLVTGGADATTADIADSTDKRYVTDEQESKILDAIKIYDSNKSYGLGEQVYIGYQSSPKQTYKVWVCIQPNTPASPKSPATETDYWTEVIAQSAYMDSAGKVINLITSYTNETALADTDVFVINKTDGTLKKSLFSLIKSTLKTYFDTLYNKYVLPVASDSVLGGVKVGDNLTIDEDGTLNADAGVTVINDLTTGGITDALSAEMGKTLHTNKVEKVLGKELSTNDFTDILKTKLDGIAELDVILADNSSIELFNIANVTSGSYWANGGTNTVSASYGYLTMNVLENQFYIIEMTTAPLGANLGCYFNGSGTFVGNVNATYQYASKTNKLAIKVIAGATVLRLNLSTASISSVSIYQAEYKYQVPGTINDSVKSNNVLLKPDAPFIYNIIDMLSARCFLDFGSYSNLGRLSTSTTRGMIAPIPVEAGEKYLVEGYLNIGTSPGTFSRGGYLDSNFAFVGIIPADLTTSSIYTIPAGTKYMVLNYEIASVATISVKRIFVPTEEILIRKESIYQSSLLAWSGKLWTSLGDSITKQELWQGYIVNYFNVTHTNCGANSTALAGVGATAFWQTVRLDAVKAANPDFITILGGANDLASNILIGTSAEFEEDLGDKDTGVFLGAYSYIIENLLTWKPTLKIFILGTTWAHNDGKALWVANGGSVTTGLTYTDFSDASMQVAKYYGLPFVDLHGEMQLNVITNTTLLSDNIHPNTAGAKRIAEVVIGRFKAFDFL